MQELAKGHAEGAAQLGAILSQLHDTAKGLSEAQRERDASLIEKLTVLAAELSKTTATANSASAAVQAINTN